MPIYAVASLVVLAWSTTIVHATSRRTSRRTDAWHGRWRRLQSRAAVLGVPGAALLVWVGFNAAWNFISLKIVSQGGGRS